MTEQRSPLGRAMPMLDAVERVTGSVKFTLDHTVPGMAHGKILRSPYPHARIVRIDESVALAVPGVIAVLTGKDLGPGSGIHPYYGASREDQPAVAIDKVRFAGDPVAVVMAESEAIAREARDLIDVEYDELPFVVDASAAASTGAPVIHDAWPENDCGAWLLERGDLDQGWAEADQVFEHTYSSPSANHVPMEPHVTIAQANEDGSIHIWTATQSPYGVQRGIMKLLSKPADQVRAQTFNLGGGYGGKGSLKLEPLTVCAAIKARRPVRIALDRDEVFLIAAKHAANVRLKTGVRADGTFVAREIAILWNSGAYAVSSPRASRQGMVRAPGPYRIPHVRVNSRAFYTNTVPTGPFRGAMTSQVCWAYEQQTDDIAHELGIDPIALRRANLLRDHDAYATGERLAHVHFLELLDEVATAIDWRDGDGDVRRATNESGLVRGKGVALLIKHTVTPSRSEARIELNADGTCTVYVSSVEMGQGARTTLLQFVADRLGVPLECISAIQPDTAFTPFDTTTSSSRTAFSMSTALNAAVNAIKHELTRLAADQLEVSTADLTCDDGRVRVIGHPEGAISYVEVMRGAGRTRISGDGLFATPNGHGVLDERGQGLATDHWHEGAAGVEIEVDTATGKIRVLRCHAASFAGHVMNPVIVRQQNEGNVIMGLGPALLEEYVYDNGQLVNPNFSDYQIPSFLDVPTELTSRSLESPGLDPEIHGVGEMTLPVVAPAIGNALFHATGVRLRDLPMTAERVFAALYQQSGKGTR